MDIKLEENEIRILAVMLEKEVLTPELYPMTLNYIKTACNQKSSRSPVMELTEEDIKMSLTRLRNKGLVMLRGDASSRAQKFEQLLSSTLKLSEGESGVMCLLMLRGPQTTGELKQRSGRLYEFQSVSQVEDILKALTSGENPLVTQLPRAHGQKESRFCHQLSIQPPNIQNFSEPPTKVTNSPESENLVADPGNIPTKENLEEKVKSLEESLLELRREFEDFKRQFEG